MNFYGGLINGKDFIQNMLARVVWMKATTDILW